MSQFRFDPETLINQSEITWSCDLIYGTQDHRFNSWISTLVLTIELELEPIKYSHIILRSDKTFDDKDLVGIKSRKSYFAL